MPTYEYECSKCGATFEAFQRMSARPLTTCKLCGAKGTVSRLVGAGAGVIFKGSGFYATDYKKSGAAAGADSKGEKKPEEIEKSAEKVTEQKEKASSASPKSSSSADKS